jgi:broad specificity phosphatase PhoE
MLQIALILPGATDYDLQGRIQGSLDIPLSESGIEEVAQISQQLKDKAVEVIYCSDCEPALQTATTLAAALGVKLKKLDKMENLDHGLWQGMLVDEVKRKQPKVYRQWQEQPESICPPEGETVIEAKERVSAAVARIVKKHKQGVIGVVVPEPLASIVRVHLRQGDLGDLWHANAGHGHWEMLKVEPEAVAHSG